MSKWTISRGNTNSRLQSIKTCIFRFNLGRWKRKKVRYNHHAQNPDTFTPMIRAAPENLPKGTKTPRFLYTNGLVGLPVTTANIFFARCLAPLIAHCAVGGQVSSLDITGIDAQSPTAHKPECPTTASVESTTGRPRWSRWHGRFSSNRFLAAPIAATSVLVEILDPSSKATDSEVAPITLVSKRISIPFRSNTR